MLRDFTSLRNLIIILLILAGFFYYSNMNRSNNKFYEGYRNSYVFIGESPIKSNDLLFLNNTDFGANSIYELGKIITPNMPVKKPGYYSNSYENSYPGYFEYV